MNATPTKLKSGDWGAKTTGGSKGQVAELVITTRAGKTWSATHKCIAAGSGWAIWAPQKSKANRPRKTRVTCMHCGEWINSRTQQCWEAGGTCIPDDE